MYDDLDVLFDRIAVGNLAENSQPRERYYHDVALGRAREILRWDADVFGQQLFETRIRLALHLSPRSAIQYERSNPKPRWKLIHSHLVSVFGRDPSLAEPLARDLARTLDSYDSNRVSVTGHLRYLLRRDGNSCQHCGVLFSQDVSPVTLANVDEYKPYHTSPEELLSPEVDHVEAVSALGTNTLKNLQLLCRLCNRGKGDGLGLSAQEEIRYAGHEVTSIPVGHRSRMLFYVIRRDGNSCTRCQSVGAELTIRPVIPSGGFVRSNLRAVCTDCVY